MERQYDTPGNEITPIKEYGFLKPTPIIPLSENYLFRPFKDNEVWLISKATLLSNNAKFERNIRLKQYSPALSDLEILKDSVKIYLSELYVSNKACSEGFNSMNIDTLINKVVTPIYRVLCDSTNSFIDDKHNKIISLLVPAASIYNSFYPFNEDCFREDNRFKYFRILCYISNTGKISFLYDNLQYLDHGDFDGDGKDEFLFWYTSHHKDGYVMFYDDFSKKS